MAGTAEQNEILKKERAIGRKAAKMAQNYIHKVLRQNLEIHGKGDDKIKPILEATKVTPKMGDYRLLGLNMKSSKVGFILHYGFAGVRQGTEVYLQASRYNKNRTTRPAHHVDLPSGNFFNDMYVKSGAVDYLLSALGETRMKAEIIKLRNLAIKLNDPENV